MAGATSWGLPWRRVLNIPKATVATKENPVKEILPQKKLLEYLTTQIFNEWIRCDYKTL